MFQTPMRILASAIIDTTKQVMVDELPLSLVCARHKIAHQPE
jgi:hypothetical protein